MTAAAGFAHFQAIAEWKSRYKGYAPQATLVDPYARFVTERWAYLIAATGMPYEVDKVNYADAEVIREYYVDANGLVWATTKATPYAPIGERGDPVRATGVGYPGGLFPRLTADGKAVWSWLILSPFQLPSSTVKALDSAAVFKKTRQHVPPLWGWRRKSLVADDAALTSKDGWSLLETPLWLSQPDEGPYAKYGKNIRVAVGFDAFAVAKERSRVFVDLYVAYQQRFEPGNPRPDSEFQRMALAQRIDDTIWLNDRAREKFGKCIDSGKLTAVITQYKEARHEAITKYEEAAARLSEVLLSEHFGILMEGAMDTEGLGDEQSPRLDEAYGVLAHCTRCLGSSMSGAAMLRYWALRSETDGRHFTNRILLPIIDTPPESHIKSFRWGSKAIMSTLAQYAAHKVSVAKISTQEQLVEKMLEPLAKLAGRKHILELGDAIEEVVAHATIRPGWLHFLGEHRVQVQTVTSMEIRTVRLDANHVKFLEDWVDASAAKQFGRDPKLTSAKTLVAGVLDVINLAMACEAAKEKIEEGKGQGTMSAVSAAAHALNLTATIADACAAEYGAATAWAKRVNAAMLGVRAVTSAVFAVSNFASAAEAYDKHDFSVSAAMAVAGVAEATSCAACIYTAVTAGSVAGPWVMLAATAVATAAYLVATWTTDEPLEVLLENCEFGTDAYGANYRPSWADAPVDKWRGKFEMQERMMMKIIGRFTVSEANRGIPIAGIEVELGMFTQRSVLTVRFEAEYASKAPRDETIEFTGNGLPDALPGVVKVATPASIWNNEDDLIPVSLVVVVRFLLLPVGQADEVRLKLIVDGKSAFPKPKSSVE